jgi:hypothetical protein
MKIVYKNNEGGVSVVTAAKAYEDRLEELAAKVVPTKTAYRIISVDLLPSTREFRNAWTDDYPGNQIDVETTKAKDIQLAKMRKERESKLTALDVESTRAMEDGDKTALADVKAKKQSLRDATNLLKAYKGTGAATDKMLARIKELGTLPDVGV